MKRVIGQSAPHAADRRLRNLAERRPGLLLVCGFAALVAVAAPYGAFAINDDWAYTFPVRWFLETGETRLTFWHAMTLVGQLLIGVGWASLFGDGDLSFRLLTATLAAGFLVAFHRLIRIGGGRPAIALAATATIAASPIFLASSLSFMTDVPHLAVSTFAVLAFAVSLRPGGQAPFWFALGLVLLVVALLIRQTAAALAIGYLAAELVDRETRRLTLVRTFLVVTTTTATLGLYAPLMRGAGLLPEVYDLRIGEMGSLLAAAFRLDPAAVSPMATAAVQAARIFGLMVAPLVAVLVVDRVRLGAVGRRYAVLAAAVFALMFLASAAFDFRLALLSASVLGPDGVGPRSVEPQAINLPATPFLAVVTVLACAGFAAFIAEVDARRRGIAARLRAGGGAASVAVMAAVVAAASFAPFGLTTLVFFDRYALFPGAFALAALAMAAPSLSRPLERRGSTSLLVIGATALVGAVLVQDSFAWNRARIRLIADFSSATGVDPGHVDAGFEFNLRLLLERRPLDSMTLSIDSAGAAGKPYVVTKRRYTNHRVIGWIDAGQIAPVYGDRLYLLERTDRTSR